MPVRRALATSSTIATRLAERRFVKLVGTASLHRHESAFDQVEGIFQNIEHDSVGDLHQRARCRVALVRGRPGISRWAGSVATRTVPGDGTPVGPVLGMIEGPAHLALVGDAPPGVPQQKAERNVVRAKQRGRRRLLKRGAGSRDVDIDRTEANKLVGARKLLRR